jgi:hypothetical protein
MANVDGSWTKRADGNMTSKLPRTLGLWSSVALVIGITIGSGIFRSPAGIAQKVPDPRVMLLLWLAGGAITLCGALSLGELAAALPETGGLYAYLREGWGRLPAFLFGWSELILIRANALGGIAIVFGEYLLRSLAIDPIEHYLVARSLSAGAIAFAAAVNMGEIHGPCGSRDVGVRARRQPRRSVVQFDGAGSRRRNGRRRSPDIRWHGARARQHPVGVRRLG